MKILQKIRRIIIKSKPSTKKEKIKIEYYPLNEPQKKTLERIKKLAKSSHFINLQFRDNGEDKYEEADFLRSILDQIK